MQSTSNVEASQDATVMLNTPLVERILSIKFTSSVSARGVTEMSPSVVTVIMCSCALYSPRTWTSSPSIATICALP
eukprot:1900606-Prymnesium_polylepis.1